LSLTVLLTRVSLSPRLCDAMQVWLEFDKDATGRMPLLDVRMFLRRLGEPLGGPAKSKDFVSWYCTAVEHLCAVSVVRVHTTPHDARVSLGWASLIALSLSLSLSLSISISHFSLSLSLVTPAAGT
jgi:hypothetical protein